MPELSDYQIQAINSHIKNIQTHYNNLSKKLQWVSFDSDISYAQSAVSHYKSTIEAAKKQADSIINSALNGNGFFFRSAGFHDKVNDTIREISSKADQIIKSEEKEIEAIFRNLSRLGNVSTSSSFFEEEEYNGDKTYGEFFSFGSASYTEDSFDSEANTEQSSAFEEGVNIPKEEEPLGEFVNSLDNIFNDTATTVEATHKEPPQKRVVITKNTHLDNDEIKTLFLSRNSKYELALDELNKAIDIVGNDIDKQSILYEALKIHFFAQIPTFNFFYAYTTLTRAIPLALERNNYDEALEMLSGVFFLESSGYLMAHSKWKERQQIDDVKIDPRITSKWVETLKVQAEKAVGEMVYIFTYSKYVSTLYNAMPKPYFSIENSAKIMVKAYEEPYEFISCKDLGIPFNQ